MDPQEPKAVTRLLQDWRAGDREALDRLIPLVHDELRRLAGRHLRGERQGHTLQTTALVNEAFLRLADSDVPWQDRVHFFAIAARSMRRILVDHAKSKRRLKRGGQHEHVALDEALVATPSRSDEILVLDEALSELAEFDERKARVIELRYFGGLTYDEVATALEISPATVHRELRMARAWLHDRMRGGSEDDEP